MIADASQVKPVHQEEKQIKEVAIQQHAVMASVMQKKILPTVAQIADASQTFSVKQISVRSKDRT